MKPIDPITFCGSSIYEVRRGVKHLHWIYKQLPQVLQDNLSITIAELDDKAEELNSQYVYTLDKLERR